MIENRGALITGSTNRVAECLRNNRVAFIGFGEEDMYAMFSAVNVSAMELMAKIKGRGRRPFVRTTASDFASDLIEASGISSEVTHPTREKVMRIFTHEAVTASRGHPIGVLLPADIERISQRLFGEGLIKVEGRPVNTVGFMVSGPDRHYLDVVSRTPSGENNHLLVGTSANFTADERDNGSGHHKVAGIVKDFGGFEDVCIFIPPEPFEKGRGPSTSIAYIEETGNTAYLARIGSFKREEMREILGSDGIQIEVRNTDNVRDIFPYGYTPIEDVLWKGFHKILWLATRRNDFHIPLALPHMLRRVSPELQTA